MRESREWSWRVREEGFVVVGMWDDFCRGCWVWGVKEMAYWVFSREAVMLRVVVLGMVGRTLQVMEEMERKRNNKKREEGSGAIVEKLSQREGVCVEWRKRDCEKGLQKGGAFIEEMMMGMGCTEQ